MNLFSLPSSILSNYVLLIMDRERARVHEGVHGADREEGDDEQCEEIEEREGMKS